MTRRYITGNNVVPFRRDHRRAPAIDDHRASPFDELTAALVLDRHDRGELEPAVVEALLSGVGLPSTAMRAPVSSIIGRHVSRTRKTDAEHLALCPFHAEQTASFIVDDSTGRFRCLSCGATGGADNFDQRMAEKAVRQ
jgi:hypothetical protein